MRYPLLLCIACAASACASPLLRDANYPAAWPDIVSSASECSGISGDFINEGFVTGDNGVLQPTSLAEILGSVESSERVRSFIGARVLSVKVERSPAVSGAQSASATLRISKHDMNTQLRAAAGIEDKAHVFNLATCECISSTLFCGIPQPSSVSPLWLMASGADIYFAKGADGSLIVKRKKIIIGWVLLVPIYNQSWVWARFEKAVQ